MPLPADGFAPGELVLQICPPGFHSYVRSTRPISSELAIYSPELEYAEPGDAGPLENNTWAMVPDGAVFMLGMYAEPASVAREKMEKAREAGEE